MACGSDRRALQFVARSLIESMSRAAKDITYLVADKFLNFGPCRAKVFAGVKFLGILGERFANRCCHGEAEVSVDIHLGAAGATSNFDVGLGDACRLTPQFATVFIDLLDQVFRNTRGSVQY